MEIKSIVFDLGGVIIDLDVRQTYNAFLKILGDGEMQLDKGYLKHPVFRQYELGEIDSDAFVKHIKENAISKTSNQEIINAWNAMLVSIPNERVELLETLGKHYRLFVLSNTNAIHEEYFEKMALGYSYLRDLFESVYYSHHIGFRKPDIEAFNHVTKESGIKPGETLFVDDLENNVKTAEKLGFQVVHVTKDLDIVEWIKNKIL